MTINLRKITQGERGTLTFTWEFPENLSSPASISGAVITATMTDEDGLTTAVSGTLTGASATTCTWALSAGDSGTAGTFTVLFKAIVTGVTTYTLEATLEVIANPAVTGTQNDPLVSISAADAAWVTLAATAVPDGGDVVDANDLGTAAYAATGDFDAAGAAGLRVAKAGDTMTGALISAPTAEPAIWFEYEPNYSEAKKWFFRFGTPTTNAGDATRKDHPFKWGYNVGPDGGRDDVTDHAFYLQMEDYYAPTASIRVAEYHLNFTSADNAFSGRPFHINAHLQTDADNPLTFTHEYKARQFTWAGMAGYNVFSITGGTNLATSFATFTAVTTFRGDSANLVLIRNAANNKTYFTADTLNEKMKFSLFNDAGFQLVNSGDAQLFAFSSDGKLTIGAGGKFAHLYIYNTTDDEALLLRPLATQTKPLMEIWNTSAAATFRLYHSGIMDFRGTMGDSAKTVGTDAPADWIEVQIAGTTRYIPAYAA